VDSLLDSRVPLTELVQIDSRHNLAVLPAGRSTSHPYEVLKSPSLAALFAELRKIFHYVVVDTAPVLPCPDPRLLEPCVDGFILVVGANRTPKTVVDSALDLMDRSKLIGLVLNGDADARAYGRRYSGYTGPRGGHRTRAK
jgi:Mrp family chromosome partitioning ATPase